MVEWYACLTRSLKVASFKPNLSTMLCPLTGHFTRLAQSTQLYK